MPCLRREHSESNLIIKRTLMSQCQQSAHLQLGVGTTKSKQVIKSGFTTDAVQLVSAQQHPRTQISQPLSVAAIKCREFFYRNNLLIKHIV